MSGRATVEQRILAAFDPPTKERVSIEILARARAWEPDAHVVLERLVIDGLVSSRELEVEGSSRPVRLYSITDVGLRERREQEADRRRRAMGE